ncbi:MAG TPA: FAD-dependent oxidoreductase [Gemmatimonadaceae bacterium]
MTRPARPDPYAHTLPLVKAEPSRVLRTTVGLRPYRPDGFVVRAEQLADKTLIHDYGHGGSGVTLCWGTAQMAIELLGHRPVDRAAVIGCGVIGLATARLLQRRGVPVTIYTAEQTPNTTSDRSGAFWAPFGLVDDDRMTPEISDRIAQAGRIAFAEFRLLMNDPKYATSQLPMYYFSDGPPEPTLEEKLLPDLFGGVTLRPGEHPFGQRYARVMDGLAIEPTPFVRALQQDFLYAGGKIVTRKLASRDELATLPEPVIFNCTGLGSRELANDETLIPMKGQLTFLQPQPEIDYMLGVPKSRLYMMPRSDAIVIGTSLVRNNWSLEPDAKEVTRVLSGIKRLR